MVRVYTTPDRYGYDDRRRRDVLDWAATRLPPDTVITLMRDHPFDSHAVREAIWTDIGWASEDLPAWRGLPWDAEQNTSLGWERTQATVALAYAQRGYEPDEAAPWAQLTHIVSEADALRGAGYTPEDIFALQALVPIEAAYDLVTTLAEDWVPLGLSPEQIRHAVLAGLTPDEAAELGEDDWPGIRTLAALLTSPDL